MLTFESFEGLKLEDYSELDSSAEFKNTNDGIQMLSADEKAFLKENVVPEIYSISLADNTSLSGSWMFNPHMSFTPPSSFLSNNQSDNHLSFNHSPTILNSSYKNTLKHQQTPKKKISFGSFAGHKSHPMGSLDGKLQDRPSFGMDIKTPPLKRKAKCMLKRESIEISLESHCDKENDKNSLNSAITHRNSYDNINDCKNGNTNNNVKDNNIHLKNMNSNNNINNNTNYTSLGSHDLSAAQSDPSHCNIKNKSIESVAKSLSKSDNKDIDSNSTTKSKQSSGLTNLSTINHFYNSNEDNINNNMNNKNNNKNNNNNGITIDNKNKKQNKSGDNNKHMTEGRFGDDWRDMVYDLDSSSTPSNDQSSDVTFKNLNKQNGDIVYLHHDEIDDIHANIPRRHSDHHSRRMLPNQRNDDLCDKDAVFESGSFTRNSQDGGLERYNDDSSNDDEMRSYYSNNMYGAVPARQLSAIMEVSVETDMTLKSRGHNTDRFHENYDRLSITKTETGSKVGVETCVVGKDIGKVDMTNHKHDSILSQHKKAQTLLQLQYNKYSKNLNLLREVENDSRIMDRKIMNVSEKNEECGDGRCNNVNLLSTKDYHHRIRSSQAFEGSVNEAIQRMYDEEKKISVITKQASGKELKKNHLEKFKPNDLTDENGGSKNLNLSPKHLNSLKKKQSKQQRGLNDISREFDSEESRSIDVFSIPSVNSTSLTRYVDFERRSLREELMTTSGSVSGGRENRNSFANIRHETGVKSKFEKKEVIESYKDGISKIGNLPIAIDRHKIPTKDGFEDVKMLRKSGRVCDGRTSNRHSCQGYSKRRDDVKADFVRSLNKVHTELEHKKIMRNNSEQDFVQNSISDVVSEDHQTSFSHSLVSDLLTSSSTLNQSIDASVYFKKHQEDKIKPPAYSDSLNMGVKDNFDSFMTRDSNENGGKTNRTNGENKNKNHLVDGKISIVSNPKSAQCKNFNESNASTHAVIQRKERTMGINNNNDINDNGDNKNNGDSKNDVDNKNIGVNNNNGDNKNNDDNKNNGDNKKNNGNMKYHRDEDKGNINNHISSTYQQDRDRRVDAKDNQHSNNIQDINNNNNVNNKKYNINNNIHNKDCSNKNIFNNKNHINKKNINNKYYNNCNNDNDDKFNRNNNNNINNNNNNICEINNTNNNRNKNNVSYYCNTNNKEGSYNQNDFDIDKSIVFHGCRYVRETVNDPKNNNNKIINNKVNNNKFNNNQIINNQIYNNKIKAEGNKNICRLNAKDPPGGDDGSNNDITNNNREYKDRDKKRENVNNNNNSNKNTGMVKSLLLPKEVIFKSVCCVGLSSSTILHITNVSDILLKVELGIQSVFLEKNTVGPVEFKSNGAKEGMELQEECFFFNKKLLLKGNSRENVKLTFIPTREGVYRGRLLVKTSFVLKNHVTNNNNNNKINNNINNTTNADKNNTDNNNKKKNNNNDENKNNVSVWSKTYPTNVDLFAVAKNPLLTVCTLENCENVTDIKVGNINSKGNNKVIDFGTVVNAGSVLRSVLVSNKSGCCVPVRLLIKTDTTVGFNFASVSVRDLSNSSYLLFNNEPKIFLKDFNTTTTNNDDKRNNNNHEMKNIFNLRDNKLLRILLPAGQELILTMQFNAPIICKEICENHESTLVVELDVVGKRRALWLGKVAALVIRTDLGGLNENIVVVS